MVARGEIWLVRLDPTVGSEISKTRPCVVVSPDGLNHLPVYIIVPMTTGSRPSPFRPMVEFGGRRGLLLPDQIKAVARERMLRKVGTLEPTVLSTLLDILRRVFAD
uniref:type II toxin-antitoxin system PemK/MazF family toxin n=1 Tax=uncultured Caulobacter sp. TaxID=158749 RepID=UPI0025F81B87|nr:type II toxin-antitoxin system PemK/MazF family toxin [uncultured Caulobacter sp.]